MPGYKFFNDPEDIKWLLETHLSHLRDSLEPFKSFMLYGNEDCPTKVELFSDQNAAFSSLPRQTFILGPNTKLRSL